MRILLLELTAALVVGVLLAAVGPYGTFAQASTTERLVYWVGVVLVAFAVYRPTCAVAARAAHKIGFSAQAAWSAAVLTMSFPLTLLVWLASYRHTPSLWPSLTEYVSFYGSVILIGAGLMLVVWLVRQASAPQQLAPATAAAEGDLVADPLSNSARLASRLPRDVRGEILALQMEDHYVRVHTAAGNTLLLMRMRDAISETDGMEGAQVHRSWWVSRAAVESCWRDGRKATLELRNGLKVPISRERMHSLPEWAAAIRRNC
jgi:uncharacterized membrane protein YhaH (DUF805 family)